MTTGKKYFGTDGIRGRAFEGKLTPTALTRLGAATGLYVKGLNSKNPNIVVGWDTRDSADMIRVAFLRGLAPHGVETQICGVIPTAGVADLTRKLGADLGIMITASHNPHHDNGLKFFNHDGQKLGDAGQMEIERFLTDLDMPETDMSDVPPIGTSVTDAVDRFRATLLRSVPDGFNLNGLKLVVDCANGAAVPIAPGIFKSLLPEGLELIGVNPTGTNINANCGSNNPEVIGQAVRDSGADLGIAFDGDADRIIMCDETGQVVDGDQLLAFLARGWRDNGTLKGDGVVATVMSNLGLERYLSSLDLTLIRTRVGDRHVAARMRADGYNLGGEQSGHMLMTDYGPSGDGILAALQVLVEFKRLDQPASQALSVFQTVPQRLINVRYEGASPVGSDQMNAAIRAGETELGQSGRILVRASGTEPVIRVMVEGDDAIQVSNLTQSLADRIAEIAKGAT